MNSISEKIRTLENHLQELEAKKTSLCDEIKKAHLELQTISNKPILDPVEQFAPEEKVKIFMNLFRGRMEIFPKRWNNLKSGKSGYSPACFNEWIRGKCNKPQIKCSECTNQAFIPVSEEIIRKHLTGEVHIGGKRDYTIGVYPMLADDTCWFLAVDFDKEHWQRDVSAFSKICHQKNVPMSLERSRSGNGGHVWIFFKQPILASKARKMASALLTETMEGYPEIGFESYDRFFPNQDTLPSGGFGNLIALPLQRYPREQGNRVFLDEKFEPYKDQWSYLAGISKISEEDVDLIVEEASLKGKILGVRIPLENEDEKPWEMKPSRKQAGIPIGQALPKSITLVLSNQIFIGKQDLPPALINKLIRLAAFQNPEFYSAQAMRLSTFGKPRIIACAENFPQYIGLPRGCLDECLELLTSLDIEVIIDDKKNKGTVLKAKFLGELTSDQKKAAKTLLSNDTGVLSASTAFGKTVVSAYMIAKRKTNTLIIVHRRQLMDQWVERLKTFLNLSTDKIGIIGGGKRKPSNVIDIAIIQSLIKNKTVDDIVAEYGQIIVDECHHLSAVSFEAVVQASKAKYVLGLTATPTRKDGHHPIIFMQCGPIRYKVDAKRQAELRPFDHKVIVRNTLFNFTPITNQKPTISQIYAEIIGDSDRNQEILNDVLNALRLGRSPLLLTEQKKHAVYFAEHFSKFCKNIVIMVGGQAAKQRAFVKEQLSSIPDNEERLLIATGRYIGEGFDDPRLDTLFLTMPISWHGTLAQYAGRLHRIHHSKKEVIIYDYVDNNVPMLAKMSEKRMKGYVKLGYEVTCGL